MEAEPCVHQGEFPEKESIFFPSREFTWILLGFDADDLYVKCNSCGWECLIHGIDRLSFFWDPGLYLPRHP